MAKYKIINPYESVMELLPDMEHHYKTNLHTHSTYSDANDTMTDMIMGFYDNDFDIVAFAEHKGTRAYRFSVLDRFDALCNDLTNSLPAEIEARRTVRILQR